MLSNFFAEWRCSSRRLCRVRMVRPALMSHLPAQRTRSSQLASFTVSTGP
jgi:hypothetical protein